MIDEKIDNNHFFCGHCKQTFGKLDESEWSSRDVQREYENAFPETLGHPTEVICEDCYIEIKKWVKNLSHEEKQKILLEYENELKREKIKDFIGISKGE